MIEEGKAEVAKPKLGKKAKPGGQLLLFDIPDKSKDVLMELAVRHTIPMKTNLYTDGWSSYKDLNFFFKNHYVITRDDYGLYDFERYKIRVNKITRFPASESAIASGNYITICTNTIENIWSHVQIDYWRCHGYSQPYAQLYLNEFMFRFNHRHLETDELFQILIQRCCNTPIYEFIDGKRTKVELRPKYKRRNKRGGGHKWELID